jgi:transcriptional regulator with XRE-family HTH domain
MYRMKTSDLVRELCKQQHISLAELSRRLGQSPQNLNKKLKRDTLSVNELKQIAEAVGVEFDLGFVLPDGSKIYKETE